MKANGLCVPIEMPTPAGPSAGGAPAWVPGMVLVLDSIFDADGIDSISFLSSKFCVYYNLIVNGTWVRGEPMTRMGQRSALSIDAEYP